MIELRFEPLAEHDMAHLEEWHQDEELARRYGGHDWPGKLKEILVADSTRSCWIVWRGEQRVGYLDFERHVDEHLAWIGLAVAPQLRGQGFGKNILEEFLRRPEVKSFREIRAGIEPDNEASVRCFASVGFRPMADAPDEEGIIDYSLTVKNV